VNKHVERSIVITRSKPLFTLYIYIYIFIIRILNLYNHTKASARSLRTRDHPIEETADLLNPIYCNPTSCIDRMLAGFLNIILTVTIYWIYSLNVGDIGPILGQYCAHNCVLGKYIWNKFFFRNIDYPFVLIQVIC